MPGGIRDKSGRKELGNAVRGHRDAVSDAIKTGDMGKVREANKVGFQKELKEIKEYSRMVS